MSQLTPAVSTEAAPRRTAQQRRDSRRALVSSYLGSTVEFYDFLLYGTAAALVFPQLFFSGVPEAAGIVLSYVTLAAGYVARPLGGIIFGHFGDKLGRKQMLFITMLIMGGVSVIMGLLPTSAQIGVAAPILLVSLRVLQGIAVGGEWAGAALMGLEHSKPTGRGFGASIAVSGGPSGAVLATVVLGAFSTMPESEFLAWGWRIPFLLSAVLVGVALFIRYRVTESPDFLAAKAANATVAPAHQGAPIMQVLRRYPKELATSIVAGFAPLFLQSLLATFALTYAVQTGHSRSDALLMLTIANFLHIFTIPAAAALSDRIGRRKVMLTGAAVGIIGIWPMFALISDGNIWLMLLGFIIGNPLVQALMYGPMGAFISEMFATEVRYTGTSLAYQVSTTLGAGFAPLIASGLLVAGGGTTTVLAWFFCGLCVISGTAFFLAPDRRLQA